MAQAPVKTAFVGYDNFKRVNPMTDRFEVEKFDHIEFMCGDAVNVARRFGAGLGLQIVAESNQASGNHLYSSVVCAAEEVKFIFTAPYGAECAAGKTGPHPNFDLAKAQQFFNKHGLAASAIGVIVKDVEAAFNACSSGGGTVILQPTTLTAENGDSLVMAEVLLYGEVALRLLKYSPGYKGAFLPGYTTHEEAKGKTYGLYRIDHIVGNVPAVLPVFNYVSGMTGWHEFAEFVAEDVGTLDSGLNSIVMASNNEMILLPINEPTFGTPRKSQIQTYLEQNAGPGVQHIALKCDDIFDTLTKMRSQYPYGFEFMPKPKGDYYKNLPAKIGNVLTPEQYQMCDDLSILVDIDDQGVLLQIFTQPLGDRSTIFVEIIQRICFREEESKKKEPEKAIEEIGGCGGFGKGNFGALFKSIEDYERERDIS